MWSINDFKPGAVQFHEILFALTSGIGYSMDRLLVLEMDVGIHKPKLPGWDQEESLYAVLCGGHCSCFGFKETKWDCTIYIKEDLRKVLDGWLREGDELEKIAAPHVLRSIYREWER